MSKKLRIAIAQLNLLHGGVSENLKKHIDSAIKARDELQADVILFPELSLSGYPVDDLLLRKSYLDSIDDALKEFISKVKNIYCIVGLPLRSENNLYNACVVIYNGEIILTYTKRILPNYGVFDEKRYFKEGDTHNIVLIHDIPVGIAICEDIWSEGPAENAAKNGAKIILSPNASPFEVNKHEQRLATLKNRIATTKIPIVYANQIGSQDEIIFDGGSMVVNETGELCQLAGFFQETLLMVEMNFSDQEIQTPKSSHYIPTEEEKIYQCLVFGVRNYMSKNHFSGALIGLSGGIDSALTLAIAVDALGKDKVKAIVMPSRYTAEMSLEDAARLTKNLGVTQEIISIEPIFSCVLASLQNSFATCTVPITEENIQARARGILLMAFSNHTQWLVLTTGNRSEMAVGYATLYGDMAGGLAVLKDIPKTMVYRLAEYRNSLEKIIPERIIERPPTAELAFNQKDENTLPPYSVLDKILELYMNEEKGAEEIIAAGFESETVRKVIKMVNQNEYKRRQSAVGIRINYTSFGRERRYPINCHFDK